MNNAIRTLTIALLALVMPAVALALPADTTAVSPTARPYITPVRTATNRTLPPPRGTDEKIIEQYLSGDTAKALAQARRDSLQRAYTRYPTLTDITIAMNIADPVLMLFGQHFANVDLSITANLWNRLQPTLEAGIGWAKNTPDGLNFTYRNKVAPYVRIGANYNFLYKSEPKYQVMLGFRLGYTNFRYSITDIHYHNTYWQEDLQADINNERSHALWGELLAGIKVGIARQWALGWTIRLHGLFNYSHSDRARPWYIPGYGPRSGKIGFTFTISHSFGKQQQKNNDNNTNLP